MQKSEVFLRDILPLIDKLTKQPSVNDFVKLNEVLENTNEIFAGRLLLIIISQLDTEAVRNKDEMQYNLIRSLEILLGKISVNKPEIFSTLIIFLHRKIFDCKNGVLLSTSEETKLAVLDCMKILFQRTTLDVIEEFYDMKNKNIVANILFAFVQIIQQESTGKLKIKAIECILNFLKIDDGSDENDIVLRSKIADVIFPMLPKLLSCLVNTPLTVGLKGHLLIAISIKTFGRLLCLTLETSELEDLPEEMIDLDDFRKKILSGSSTDSIPEDMNGGIISRKNQKLIQSFNQKLKPYLDKLITFTQHDHPTVRNEVLSVSKKLLKKCGSNLEYCQQTLLEIIFSMTLDEDERIKKHCEDDLLFLKGYSRYSSFIRSSERIIDALLMKLPQCVLREDEHAQALGFTILQAAIDFIPSTALLTLLTNELLLEKLTTLLIIAAEVDLKNKELLSENSSPEGTPWRQPRWLIDKKSQKAFQELCKSLNRPQVTLIVASKLLQTLELRSSASNQALIILNFMLISEEDPTNPWMMELLQELLKDIHWNLALQLQTQPVNSPIEDDALTLEDVKFNIIHSCLVLEAVGNCARKMKSIFQPFLFKVFHRILAKAACSNVCVKGAAEIALDDLKTSFDAESIVEFLNSNVDYVIFYVSKFLKKNYSYDDGLGMLQLILEYSSKNEQTQFFLETILSGLVQDIEKVRDEQKLKDYFKIYQMFLTKIFSWTEEEVTEIIEVNREQLVQQWLEILNQQVEDLDFNEEEPEPEREPEDEPKKNLPNHVNLTVEILRMVLKYISTKDQDLCLVSLEVLKAGISVLAQFEDKLLPVVHQIWFPLSEKFKCGNPVILRQCFELLIIMGKTSKDFIRQRTLKDVIPKINAYLKEVSKNSKKEQSSMYRFSQECKSIHMIISHYGHLIADIQLEERDFDNALNSVLIYLEKGQPDELQKITLEFCEFLLKYDAPTVYLKLRKYPKFLSRLKL
ncbi:hypothetical protein DMENIID0001_133810 [Sergentomyia squamirostris]